MNLRINVGYPNLNAFYPGGVGIRKSKIMKISEEAIQYLENHIPEMAAAAVKLAYWQALTSGSSVLISENGTTKEVFPDGIIKIIRENAPFMKTRKGQIIKLK